MVKYYILCDMYESKGGSFKYAVDPVTKPIEFSYNREEREQFIEKATKLLRDEMYYTNVKMYFINFTEVTILEIDRDKLSDMKHSI